ncbi:MAG: membrane protein insertase YidC [Oscillospiraceae bacterium]|nr:membrane protein insertase YidC [Oscillospiraceae bacterium]
MGQIWDFLIVQPIAFLLRSLYYLTNNYGAAILLFAVAAKMVLFFFSFKGKRGMLQQQRLQPKIQELQKKYGKDKQRMQQEQAKLYQDEGVSMFGGCLWMFIPFPLIIALYGAVRQPLTYILQWTSAQIDTAAEVLRTHLTEAEVKMLDNPGMRELFMAQRPEIGTDINFNFLGINLAAVPSFVGLIVLIPLLSAFTSFLSAWLTQKFSGRPSPGGSSTVLTFLLGPGISLWIGFSWPAALGVYWIAQNLLGIPQEYFLTRYFNKKLDGEEARKAELEERRKEAEAKQREEDRARRAERIAEQNKKHKPKRYKLKPVPKEDTEDE